MKASDKIWKFVIEDSDTEREKEEAFMAAIAAITHPSDNPLEAALDILCENPKRQNNKALAISLFKK